QVLAARQSGRSAGNGQSFVAAQPRPRRRRAREIEIDVVGREEIEAAVAIVVDEGAAGVPARTRLGETRRARDVGEAAVALVVIQAVLPVVGHEEIVAAVVVVVADAGALSPSARGESGAIGDVLERAAAAIAKEMVRRGPAGGKSFEGRAVDEEQIE